MATTCFFEQIIKDQDGKNSMELEFGRSSYYGNDSIYIRVGNEAVCVDRETAKKIADAMDDLAAYLAL